ncbi:MAG: LLM class flavin-dependent oxidoreductase [Streptosporangiales bacterium]|nr:LLM class flavin-dependent oxidoreductase [Streptosporangiales bacterium]
MTRSTPLHLAVALDGAGWHPAAWRSPGARPGDLFTADYWRDLVTTAERGSLDFVTIEDSLGPRSSRRDGVDDRTDHVRGRLDAALLAARVAPLTSHIGLVPTVTTTHTEPFHVSTALATLDFASKGRAGWQVKVSASATEAAHFGRRRIPPIDHERRHDPETVRAITQLFGEAADTVEVVRRLWDSWEDDAVIRDVTTGRFVDRDKLHYVDFAGDWFSVRGPSITPRPPQGQPVVTALAHAEAAYLLAARAADVVFVTPHDIEEADAAVSAVRDAERAAGRDGEPLRVFVDLVVFVDTDDETAGRRKALLDELDGAEYASDAAVFVGTADRLADLLTTWRRVGVDGFRLRPGVLPHDLTALTERLVPALQARDAFRRHYEQSTLRGLLGLTRPASRYTAAAATPAT